MDYTTLTNSPWAIEPSALQKIISFDPSLLADPMESFEASNDNATHKEKMAEFMAQFDEQLYISDDGVATISINGPLMPNPDIFDRFYHGAADSVRIANLIRAAANSAEIESLVMLISSPGGMVIGTPEMGSAVRAFNDTGRESYAFADVLMASGAYWLGSQAKNLIVTESALVGSIGVVRPHVDATEAHAKGGIKVEIFRGGKHKVAGAYGTSLTEEQRKHIQDGVDDVHEQFKETVNLNRSIADENMQGQVFYGRDAVKVNLVDGLTENVSAILATATPSSGNAPASISVDTANGATMSKDSDITKQDEQASEDNQDLESVTELDAANTRIEELDAENAELASDVAAAQDEIEGLSNAVDEAVSSIVGLKAELSEAQNKITELESDFDAKVGVAASEKAEGMSEQKAAEIAAQSGTDASDLSNDSDDDASIEASQLALMDINGLWAKHAEITESEGHEEARAFYEANIRSRR